MAEKRLLWVILLFIGIYIIETKELPDVIVLLIALSLIIAYMAWETRIWEIFKKT